MFLILGTSECKYCIEAKKLLETHSLKYMYIDVSLKLGVNWRSIFVTLKTILNGQRSIPIIFKLKEHPMEPIEPVEPADYTPALLNQWDLLGSYFELEDSLDDDPLSIDNDY